MAIFLKASYTFSAVLNISPMSFFTNRKKILKFIWKNKIPYPVQKMIQYGSISLRSDGTAIRKPRVNASKIPTQARSSWHIQTGVAGESSDFTSSGTMITNWQMGLQTVLKLLQSGNNPRVKRQHTRRRWIVSCAFDWDSYLEWRTTAIEKNILQSN